MLWPCWQDPNCQCAVFKMPLNCFSNDTLLVQIVEGKVPELIKWCKTTSSVSTRSLKYCLCRKSFIYSSWEKVEHNWKDTSLLANSNLECCATLDVVLLKMSLCREARDLVHRGESQFIPSFIWNISVYVWFTSLKEHSSKLNSNKLSFVFSSLLFKYFQ